MTRNCCFYFSDNYHKQGGEINDIQLNNSASLLLTDSLGLFIVADHDAVTTPTSATFWILPMCLTASASGSQGIVQ